MKILEVNKLYFPWSGGIEQTVQDIAEGLNKIDWCNIEVLVCQPKGKRKTEEINGVTVHRASSLGMLLGMPISFSFFLLFRRLSKKVDILHIHHPFPLSAVAYLLSRPRARLIVHYHSDIVRQKISNFFLRPFLKRFLNHADLIIVTNPIIIESSKILKKHRNKCLVVPSGIDLEKFKLTPEIQKKSEEIRKKFSSPLVLFVGRLIYYKGVEFLIEAFKDIPAQLVIVGSGPLDKKLKILVKNLGLSEKIHFVGKLLSKELISYYYASDIFVLPSVAATEALGLVQIEAMACGKPVISTNLSTGVPWVNQHEKTGLVVPPKDIIALSKAINILLGNKELRKNYGKNGKDRSKKFSKELMVKKIISYYASLNFSSRDGRKIEAADEYNS